MTEEFKQALVQSIIDQRGFTENEQIYKDLVALVKESNDQLFIAKVYNDLAMYDKIQAQMSNQLISFESAYSGVMGQPTANPTLATFNKAVDNNAESRTWRNPQSPKEEKFAADIYRGLDVAAGLKGPEGSENASKYYDYLNTKLEQIVEETGTLGVIVRPPRGEGGQIYVTEDLNEWFLNNPPRDMTEGFYPTEGKDYKKYPGFAKPTILTKPVMTFNDESGYYEHTGDYLFGAETFNDSGKFNTALDTGDTFQVAVGVNRPDGTSTGEIQTLSYDELQLLNSEVEGDPSKTIINVSGDKQEINAQLQQWIDFNTQQANAPEYDIFGGISPDYAIYKQPDVADAFKDGDPTAAQMKDAMLPQQVYAGNIPEGQFYGGTDHISGQGPGMNGTQKISWISLAPQEIKAVQVDLMQAGYITAEDFFLEQGAWQGKTSQGMYSAMVDANLNMIDVYSQLNSEKERYFKKPPLAPKVYATPSPGFIKGEIDNALRSAGVTRKLTDAELIAFSDFYIGADKDYETASAEYSKNLDLANRLFPGAPDSISIPSTPSEELAAFAEQKFEPELAAQQRGIQEKNDLSFLFSSLDQFDNMIGR
jgi:hypothetical protein